MKATGIVRRIDDLGRVVIPKDVRRIMRLREGEPLEIFIEGDYVCFKRYQTNLIEEIQTLCGKVQEYAEDIGYGHTYEIKALFDPIYKLMKKMEEDA